MVNKLTDNFKINNLYITARSFTPRNLQGFRFTVGKKDLTLFLGKKDFLGNICYIFYSFNKNQIYFFQVYNNQILDCSFYEIN